MEYKAVAAYVYFYLIMPIRSAFPNNLLYQLLNLLVQRADRMPLSFSIV